MRSHTLLAFPALLLAYGMTPALSRADFVQTDLVSDVSGLAPAMDPDLKNPWGMSFGATTPFWVSNQASNTSTLYDPLGMTIKVPLTVNIPTGGATPPTGPTGQVFNNTASDFMIPAPTGAVKSAFLFVTLQGTLEGWNPGSTGAPANAEGVASVPKASFTGLTLDSVGGSNYLYAADATGSIRVFNGSFTNVTSTTFAGKFVDPAPVSGFTPFNIQNLGGNLFVTYAAATSTGAPLPGGYVDEYSAAGNFIQRIATAGPLNAPWGLALAPMGFGSFGGDLLVGNLYNSTIDAYNLGNHDNLDGSITVKTGFSSPVGLWALDFGNGATGNADTLYFDAGVNNQKDGLFGEIRSVPEPGYLALFVTALAGLLVHRWRRGRASAPSHRAWAGARVPLST
ncbi:MAG: TIGR03118 family protein [Steroidobacteraceae bacterium]